MDLQVPHHEDIMDKANFVPEGADLDPVDNDTCKPKHLDSERKNEPFCMPIDGGSIEHSILSSTYPTMGVCKEESTGVTHFGGGDRPNGAQVEKYRSLNVKR